MNILIITIDGPAGSGKSTVAKKIADILKFTYLDTGAMYRAVALYFNNNNVNYKSNDAMKSLLENIKLNFNGNRIYLNNIDVEDDIRTEEITKLSSPVSAIKIVREKMISLQRKIGENRNLVCEGRDMGSVVFPNAKIKIFLTASIDERVKRRKKDYLKKCINIEKEKLKDEMNERDKRDSERKLSPLKPARDAIILDSSELTIDEVVNKIFEEINGIYKI